MNTKNSAILDFPALTASGTDTYTALYTPYLAEYTTGLKVHIIFTNANTGASTLNLNSLGAVSIKKKVTSALISGDILAGKAYCLIYDGTNFQLLNPDTGFPSILTITSGNQTTTSNNAGNITDLVFPALANSVYTFSGSIHIGCNNAGGVVFAVTLPTGATVYLFLQSFGTSGATYQFTFLNASATLTTTAVNRVNAQVGAVLIAGTVTTAGTAGNIQFQFASATNGQTSTVFQEGTFLKIDKVA